MTDLELTFDNITPQNLKDNETIAKLLKLYNSSFEGSTDILENPLNVLDTDFLIDKFEQTSNTRFDDIRKEIFKIHLQEIYQTFEEIGDSEEIYKKFIGVYKALGVPPEELKIVADIDKSIDSQYLDAASSFKTKKGTKSGFFFVYDIINRAGVQAINSDAFFNLIEGTKEDPNTPYEYTVETSLYREVFDKTVVPLAHPVGFDWNFIRLLFLTMEDYFGLEQIKTLGKTTLTCYGADDSTLAQQEIVESGIYGTVKDFMVAVNQEKKEQVIIDYNPLDETEGDGLRLIKDFNGSVILYDRQSVKALKDPDTGELTGETQYLEISEVKLVQEQNGELTVNKIQRTLLDETFEVIDSVSFKEYSIIDKENVLIKFKIRGGTEDAWNYAKLPLTKKIISDDIKFFKPEYFDRQGILDSSSSYNGRIVKDRGSNCLLAYKATYSYKVSTKDVSEYVEGRRPYSVQLATDVNDIDIPQSEYNIAIEEGRDPYKDKYATHDHTLEEFNWYDTGDNWGRLAYGNYKLTGNIGDMNIDPKFNKGHIAPEKITNELTGEVTLIPDGEITDLTIGGDWILSNEDTHEFDKGFNPNARDGAHWEQYYRPLSQKDLELVNSTNTIQRYERDNTEWYGDKTKQWNSSQNNNEYIAWEDFNMDVQVKVFEREREYILDDTFEDINYRPTINTPADGLQYVDGQELENLLNNQAHTIQGELVDADPVNLQAYTTEQIFISTYIPLKDAWTRIGNNLSLFNVRDLAEAEAGDVPVIDSTDMDETWNIDYEVFGINGSVNPKTGVVTNEGDYQETKHNTDTWPMFTKQEYSYETFEEWYIGDEGQNIGQIYVDGQGHYELVDADVYRGMWSFREDHEDFRKFERFDFTEKKDFGEEIVAEDNTIEDEDGVIKIAHDNRTDTQFTHTFDEFYKGELTNLDIGDFDINGTVRSEYRDDDDRPASIDYEYMYKESFTFGIGFNLITIPVEYCYDTMENWEIGDDQDIGCAFIDGLPHHEEVQAEIYRAQWNYNYYINNKELNPDFEKFEFTKFVLKPTVNEIFGELQEPANDVREYKVFEDDVAKDWNDLRIDDFDIGGEHDNIETNSSRKAFIGYEYMFQDDTDIYEGILGTPKMRYAYNTFIAVYIGDELNIADDEDFIDGKGINIDIEADLYRSDWNVHDDSEVTEDNVITAKFEVYGMKVYKKDDDDNWVYMPDNNIEAA